MKPFEQRSQIRRCALTTSKSVSFAVEFDENFGFGSFYMRRLVIARLSEAEYGYLIRQKASYADGAFTFELSFELMYSSTIM